MANEEVQQPNKPAASAPMQSQREGNNVGASAVHIVSPGTNKAASGTEEEAVDYD